MNKQNIDKLSLFLSGIEQRIIENYDFFKKISIEYKSGVQNDNRKIYNITRLAAATKVFRSQDSGFRIQDSVFSIQYSECFDNKPPVTSCKRSFASGLSPYPISFESIR